MARKTYEAPAIIEIGSLHDMTLAQKFTGAADGTTYGPAGTPGVPIGDVSA